MSQIPVLGKGLFSHNPLVYLSLILVGALTWVFRSTYLGLSLEAAGNKPAALDAAGVDVVRTRSFAVLCTGFLAGLGGAYMANVGAGLFVPFITGGAGVIGIVLAMLARGRPLWVLIGAALFGASLAMTTALQVAGIDVPTDVVQMLPFAVVMLVLVIFARNSMLPSGIGHALCARRALKNDTLEEIAHVDLTPDQEPIFTLTTGPVDAYPEGAARVVETGPL